MLKAGGSGFVYSTFIYNSNLAGVDAVSVDGAGNAYVAGAVEDDFHNFPVLNPIQACGVLGSGEPFVSEFNSAGALVFSTCLGVITPGGSIHSGVALTLDSSENVYLASSLGSGLPLKNPIDSNPQAGVGFNVPFVSEISSSSHTLIFSSYVGAPDPISSVAVDPNGDIYLAGTSLVGVYSLLPIFNALQPDFNTVNINTAGFLIYDGFVMKISPSAGAAAAVAPGALAFGPTVVGSTTAPQTATIYDLGTDGLTVSNVAISGDFGQSNNCGSVAASGGSCAIQVTFTPTVLGTRNGTLTITDSSAGSPRQVALTGTGATGNFTPSAATLTFPSQAIATTSGAQTVTFTAGAVAVQSFNIQTSGDFSETNTCGTSVAAFATCALSVSFAPTATGTRTGTVTVTDSAPNSPQVISLTGTGVAGIGLFVASGGSSILDVTAGSNASYSLAIGGEGMNGTASISCTGAPAGATCSVPATVSVSAMNAATFGVTVTTTSRAVTAFRFGGPHSFAPLLLVLIVALVVVLLGRQTVTPSVRAWALCLFLLASLGLLYACGGGSAATTSSGGTPAGTYQIVVSAQLGSASQSTNLTLIVQ